VCPSYNRDFVSTRFPGAIRPQHEGGSRDGRSIECSAFKRDGAVLGGIVYFAVSVASSTLKSEPGAAERLMGGVS